MERRGDLNRRRGALHHFGMAASLRLPTKLSWVLIAFTIEFDNEFEHRAAHRTTQETKTASRGGGLWLTSQVIWANAMQYLPPEGIAVGELHVRARTTKDSLAGLQRRGYVAVNPPVVRGDSTSSMLRSRSSSNRRGSPRD
jgi:hypothetical protein